MPKKRGEKAMKRYDENFKIEALKLSDEIGVKKACELNTVQGSTVFMLPQSAQRTQRFFMAVAKTQILT